MANSIKVEIRATEETNALLLRLPIAVREKYLKQGLRKAGAVVRNEARKRCPKGGPRTGDKEGKKHLADTIRSEQRDYGEKLVQVIGPEYPAGAHGHLVEFGHEEVLFGRATGRRVPPHPFMRPAADTTKDQQLDALNDAVRAGIEKEASLVP